MTEIAQNLHQNSINQSFVYDSIEKSLKNATYLIQNWRFFHSIQLITHYVSNKIGRSTLIKLQAKRTVFMRKSLNEALFQMNTYSPSRIETEGMQCYGTCICVYSTSV